MSTVNLMKIDVDHAEFKVIEGAQRVLNNTLNLVVELHDPEMKGELSKTMSFFFPEVRRIDETDIFGTRENL